MSIEGSSAPPATALDTVLVAAGAVLTRRQGHAVAVNFGSAAGELAACVSAVGLACCSDLTKLVVATGTPAARRGAERMAGGPIAPGGARCERGTWWAALGAERFIVLCGPTHDQALREQLATVAQRTPGLGVSDRTEDWAAIAVVGRGKDRVLGNLGVYGAGRDPRQGSPLTAHSVAGTSVEWLLQSDHQALALMSQSEATAVWRAIEMAGRAAGICAVGRDALTRYALLHHEPAL